MRLTVGHIILVFGTPEHREAKVTELVAKKPQFIVRRHDDV